MINNSPIECRLPVQFGEVGLEDNLGLVAHLDLSVEELECSSPVVTTLLRGFDLLDSRGHPTMKLSLLRLEEEQPEGAVVLFGIERTAPAVVTKRVKDKQQIDFSVVVDLRRDSFGPAASSYKLNSGELVEVGQVLRVRSRIVASAEGKSTP